MFPAGCGSGCARRVERLRLCARTVRVRLRSLREVPCDPIALRLVGTCCFRLGCRTWRTQDRLLPARLRPDATHRGRSRGRESICTEVERTRGFVRPRRGGRRSGVRRPCRRRREPIAGVRWACTGKPEPAARTVRLVAPSRQLFFLVVSTVLRAGPSVRRLPRSWPRHTSPLPLSSSPRARRASVVCGLWVRI